MLFWFLKRSSIVQVEFNIDLIEDSSIFIFVKLIHSSVRKFFKRTWSINIPLVSDQGTLDPAYMNLKGFHRLGLQSAGNSNNPEDHRFTFHVTLRDRHEKSPPSAAPPKSRRLRMTTCPQTGNRWLETGGNTPRRASSRV